MPIDPMFPSPKITSKPLSGVTILLVEDSRYCSEAVRMMAQRSGARLRRADSLRAAGKHLAMYRPDVVLVDVGLPDGSGLELVVELKSHQYDQAAHQMPVLVISGDTSEAVQSAAREAGADGFLAKPIQCLEQFQMTLERAVHAEASGPRVLSDGSGPVDLDPLALSDDLERVGLILEEALAQVKDQPDAVLGSQQLRYGVQFVASLAEMSGDQGLKSGAARFFARATGTETDERAGEDVLALVRARLAAKEEAAGRSVA